MIRPLPSAPAFDFPAALSQHGLGLERGPWETLQLNLTRLCNQACLHCHVDASPRRKEQMSQEVAERCLQLLEEVQSLKTLDLTGGAPELNPHFEALVSRARQLGKHVMVRHNLTVTLDGNPQSGASKAYLPAFFAAHQVEVVSSLPYPKAFLTDRQRGRGIFKKSIESLRLLNAQGYGEDTSSLLLTLVSNPAGAYLPPDQASLEADFKRQLWRDHQVRFSRLFVITNMPIHRFRTSLERKGTYQDYMYKLVRAFNPQATEGLMCRSLLSVDHEGRVYDCDFNQMLSLQLSDGEGPLSVFNLPPARLKRLSIRVGEHCFGCTAGAGSSCGGETT